MRIRAPQTLGWTRIEERDDEGQEEEHGTYLASGDVACGRGAKRSWGIRRTAFDDRGERDLVAYARAKMGAHIRSNGSFLPPFLWFSEQVEWKTSPWVSHEASACPRRPHLTETGFPNLRSFGSRYDFAAKTSTTSTSDNHIH